MAPLDRDDPPTQLIDSFGRVIRDLRLSITDRCNFRCVYCMDPDVKFAPRDELLSIEEHLDIARVAVGLGVTKLRITGGEPALHPGLIDLIKGLAGLNVQRTPDIAITTNGSFLNASTARAWREAGLTRVTLSLDSLRQDRFATITRSNATVDDVLAGIEVAKSAGLDPVRVNAVVVRGFNEDELVDLARLARDMAIDVRLIEYMPLDSAHAWERKKVVTAAEMLDRIGRVFPLEPVGRDTTSSPATVFRFKDQPKDHVGRLGIIASVTRSFCSTCSRLRITADGKVRPCLFAHDEWDIRPLLRGHSQVERSEPSPSLPSPLPPPPSPTGEVPSLRGGGGLPATAHSSLHDRVPLAARLPVHRANHNALVDQPPVAPGETSSGERSEPSPSPVADLKWGGGGAEPCEAEGGLPFASPPHRNGTHEPQPSNSQRDHAIARFLADAVYAKKAGHMIDSPEFRQPARTMSAIGG